MHQWSIRLIAIFAAMALNCGIVYHERSASEAAPVLAATPSLPAGALSDPRIPTSLIDPTSDARLAIGAGFDSITGTVKPPCINQSVKDLPPAESSGQNGGLHFTRINSLDDEESALGVDAKASYGIGLFSADASVKYLSTSSVDSYESYMLIDEPLSNAKQLLSGYTLNKTGKQAYHSGLLTFIAVCGDQYIAGRVTGGKLQAMLHVDSKTEADKVKADATLNASGWGAKLSATVEQQLQSLKDSGRLQVDIIRQGPSEPWPHATVQDLIDYAESFPPKIHCTGKETPDSPCLAWTTDYISADYSEVLGKWGLPAQQADFFSRESTYLKTLFQALGDFRYVAASANVDPDGEFGPADPSIVRADVVLLTNEITNVQTKAINCARDVMMCTALTHIAIPTAPLRASAWITVDPTYNTPRLYQSVVGGDGALAHAVP
jgi:hypothetical protein